MTGHHKFNQLKDWSDIRQAVLEQVIKDDNFSQE